MNNRIRYRANLTFYQNKHINKRTFRLTYGIASLLWLNVQQPLAMEKLLITPLIISRNPDRSHAFTVRLFDHMCQLKREAFVVK